VESGRVVKTVDAMGFCERRGIVKIAVLMPIADFDELKRRAVKEGTSISAQIREYVHLGLQVDADMEGDSWPPPEPRKEEICMVDISRAPGLQAALLNRSECLGPSSLAAGTAVAEVTRDDHRGNLVPDIPQAAEAGCDTRGAT
jgi:hypothetical protein